jgi:hypothetical protein
MSSKSGKKSEKDENKQQEVKPKIVKIFLKIFDLGNFKNLGNDDEEIELEIKGKFLNTSIDCKNVQDENLCRFKATDDDVNLLMSFSVNVDDEEEVVNLFSNPAQRENLLKLFCLLFYSLNH